MRARATAAVITQLPGRSFLVSVDPIPWALSTAVDIAAHAINIHNFFQTSLLLVLCPRCPVGVPGYYIAVKHALSFASLRGWQHCWNRNEEKSEQEKQHDLYTYNKSAMTTSSKVCLAKVWEKKTVQTLNLWSYTNYYTRVPKPALWNICCLFTFSHSALPQIVTFDCPPLASITMLRSFFFDDGSISARSKLDRTRMDDPCGGWSRAFGNKHHY